MKIAFTILGEASSKANSRKIVKIGGEPRLIKSEKALSYERDALRQIPPTARVALTGPVSVSMRIFYATERPDLDESLILDILQNRYTGSGEARKLIQRGVYENDRQVREKHVYHAIDRREPRCEIVVEPLQAQQDSLFGPSPVAEPKPKAKRAKPSKVAEPAAEVEPDWVDPFQTNSPATI